MSTVAARHRRSPAVARTRSERIFAALPLVSVFVWLCLLYAWQAWAHASPWLFKDELEYTQVARSIAETGQPGRRGEPEPFTTLYAYLVAPAWLLNGAQNAYEAAKYIGVVTMASVVFPTYALARLLVSRPAAVFAAAASASIPAFMYSSLILTEPLAYPYTAACFFLIVKALATRRRRWMVLAVAVSLLAPLVRPQLAVIPGVLALATALFAASGPRARSRRSGWSPLEWAAGALVAVVGALVASELIGRVWGQWAAATLHPRAMLDHGVWALGALAIGVGVLPVLAAAAGLWHRASSEAYRPFVCLLSAAVAGFALYAAGKAAYLATFFESRVEERNVIYLSPLLFVATAMWLECRRFHALALAVASAVVAYLIVATPYQLDPSALYADAPSLSVLSYANRYLGWSEDAIQTALLVVVAVSAGAIVLLGVLRRRALAAVVAATLAALVVAWNLTGEVAAAYASNEFSKKLLASAATPVDWVDRATGGAPTLFLGQGIRDPNAVQLLEFWNRSIAHVWSLDDSAPGPGPTPVARLARADGTLAGSPDVDYAVAGFGIELDGVELAERSGLRLYRTRRPLRLRSAITGLDSDGWMGSDSTYSQYASAGGRAGVLTVVASRLGACGPSGAARVRVSVGKLAVAADGRPTIRGRRETQADELRFCQAQPFPFISPRPPFHVHVEVEPTFVPAELDPRISDRRSLGAQMSFGFVPDVAARGTRGGTPGPRARRTPRTTP